MTETMEVVGLVVEAAAGGALTDYVSVTEATSTNPLVLGVDGTREEPVAAILGPHPLALTWLTKKRKRVKKEKSHYSPSMIVPFLETLVFPSHATHVRPCPRQLYV